MSEGVEGAAKGLGIFSTLETATDLPFFLLATSFALAVDSAIAHFHGKGLFGLVADPSLIHPSLGLEVILVFIGFSFLTSTALPFVAIFFDGLVAPLIFWVSGNLAKIGESIFGESTHLPQRRHDYVRPWELREEAHDSKDSYLLSLLAKHEDEARRAEKLMFKTAFYGFCTLVMVGVNYFVVDDSKNSTLLGTLVQFCDSTAPVWIALVGLFIVAYSRYWKDDRRQWIYCPTLYREVEKREKKKRAIFSGE